MKKTTKVLAIVLSVLMLISAIPLTAGAATSGACGDRLTWSLNTYNGNLTISGTGDMFDYSDTSRAPWYSYRASIRSVQLPDGITGIGSYAFDGCGALRALVVPDSVKRIGSFAFNYCSGLTSVSFGSALEDIGEKAFFYCTGLTSVTIPASVKNISKKAFSGCYKLVEVINKSALSIEIKSSDNGSAAYYAKTVHSGNTKIDNVNGYLFYTADGADWLLGYVGDNTILTLPKDYNGGEYKIYQYAFYDRSDVNGVTFTENVTYIGNSAFRSCTSLVDVSLVKGVTELGNEVFSGCTSLKSVLIPADVTAMGTGVFDHCEGLTVSCYPGSFAESYAKQNGIKYVLKCAHSYVVTVIKPTCTEQGYTKHVCSKCGDTIIDTYVEAAGHDCKYAKWSKDVLYNDLLKTAVCNKCKSTCTVTTPLVENPFTDVSDGAWYNSAARYCFMYGYIGGTSDAIFSPNVNMNRAMFATILYKIATADEQYSASSFGDVKTGTWYANPVEWAYRHGYASGTGKDRNGRPVFSPTATVTRETLAVFLRAYAEKNGYPVSEKANLKSFRDYGQIHSWALDAMQWAVAAGLISGTSKDMLSPCAPATRAAVAQIIMNFTDSYSCVWVLSEMKARTCTVPGTARYTCLDCDKTLEVSLPAWHVWNSGVNTVSPTCTESGTIVYTCNVCKQTKSVASKPYGHDWNNCKITYRPAADGSGCEAVYHCNRDYSHIKTQKLSGHQWNKGVNTKNPTCTAAGTIVYTCTRCGGTYSKASAAYGHVWNSGVITKNPTCSVMGTKVYTCSRCKSTKTEYIPKVAHKYSNGYCVYCRKPQNAYTVGQTWVVPGEWELTIDSITRHYDCNMFERKPYSSVIQIRYHYRNIGYSTDWIGRGLEINFTAFDVYDAFGYAGEVYPCTHVTDPKECKLYGTSSYCGEAFSMDNNGSYATIVVTKEMSHSDSNATAMFWIPING